MTDIVKRARDQAGLIRLMDKASGGKNTSLGTIKVLEHCAAEIENLRAELAEAREIEAGELARHRAMGFRAGLERAAEIAKAKAIASDDARSMSDGASLSWHRYDAAVLVARAEALLAKVKSIVQTAPPHVRHSARKT